MKVVTPKRTENILIIFITLNLYHFKNSSFYLHFVCLPCLHTLSVESFALEFVLNKRKSFENAYTLLKFFLIITTFQDKTKQYQLKSRVIHWLSYNLKYIIMKCHFI